MDMLSIGQVARRAGVGVETVRFYEREGLLDPIFAQRSGDILRWLESDAIVGIGTCNLS